MQVPAVDFIGLGPANKYMPGELIVQPQLLIWLAHAPAAAPVGASASASIIANAAAIAELTAFLANLVIICIAPPMIMVVPRSHARQAKDAPQHSLSS
jgi:diadenosine tetraphosphate (Ap4A) HIT family hydrolase